jgi:hypothetical protein
VFRDFPGRTKDSRANRVSNDYGETEAEAENA